MKRPLEGLVVEDREENIEAAKEAFEANPEADMDYARTLEGAYQRLHSNPYVFVLSDWNFPRTSGESPQQSGKDLNDVLKPPTGIYSKPNLIITSGKHHGKPVAQIYDGFSVIEDLDGAIKITDTKTKDNPEAWRTAFEEVKNLDNIENIVRSERRFFRYNDRTEFQPPYLD